jgi:hypothetical protein
MSAEVSEASLFAFAEDFIIKTSLNKKNGEALVIILVLI